MSVLSNLSDAELAKLRSRLRVAVDEYQTEVKRRTLMYRRNGMYRKEIARALSLSLATVIRILDTKRSARTPKV